MVDIKQITGTARTVSELLMNNRYSLRFFQREYSWGASQVGELIDDLTNRFQDEFDSNHRREDTASYRPYFLGPIVTEHQDGVRYLADGQQRITTLSLLLIHLKRCLTEKFPEDANALQGLIYSYIFDKYKFNIDVSERTECMNAIVSGEEFDAHSTGDSSVRNLWNRYKTIEERFPDLEDEKLPFFVDWLKFRVIFVEIVAPDQDMALEIFETMNDRGLRLNNTDMLKGYLLANVGKDETLIRDLDGRWKRRVTELSDIKENAGADFIKAWLRGKYATTKRENRPRASPGDFDIIYTAFHKWVRDNAKQIGIFKEADFQNFVENEFLKLSSRYLELLQASKVFKSELASVYYIAYPYWAFTLQLLVILAAIKIDDDDTIFIDKANLVAGALDIFVVRRMVNNRNFGYDTVIDRIFNLTKQIRNRSTDEIRGILADWLRKEHEKLDGIYTFQLTKRNRKHVFYLLARITSWLDEELNRGMTFHDYIDQSRKDPFQVEHIWANRYERHIDEFDHKSEFDIHRNKFGDLLLLPRSFNAAYGDMPYCEKVEHYFAQNPLASSLHPRAYEKNSNFRRLIENQNLKFVAYPETFTKADISARQELYKSLADIVWDPNRVLGLTN